MKESAAVIVADEGQCACRSKQSVKIVSHAFELVHVRHVRLGENRVKQEHVERVNVIVGGLLEMTSIGVNLPLHLLAHHFRAKLLPTCGFRQPGEKQSESMQCK